MAVSSGIGFTQMGRRLRALHSRRRSLPWEAFTDKTEGGWRWRECPRLAFRKEARTSEPMLFSVMVLAGMEPAPCRMQRPILTVHSNFLTGRLRTKFSRVACLPSIRPLCLLRRRICQGVPGTRRNTPTILSAPRSASRFLPAMVLRPTLSLLLYGGSASSSPNGGVEASPARIQFATPTPATFRKEPSATGSASIGRSRNAAAGHPVFLHRAPHLAGHRGSEQQHTQLSQGDRQHVVHLVPLLPAAVKSA